MLYVYFTLSSNKDNKESKEELLFTYRIDTF